MRVSIIGAGRNRNGIGEYIAKYFHKNGANITSILGRTKKTASNASSALRKYGISSAPYTDFHNMVEEEKPDAAVIASPSSTHYGYLVKCLDYGCNIFCEKPFIWQETDDVGGVIENIFERAGEKNITIAMNSQWPFSIKYYEKICGPIDHGKTDKFFISSSPISSGKNMIPDSVPHALSILYCVFGDGKIEDLHFEPDEEKMIIKFKYISEINDCDVHIRLVRKEQQPRDFLFGFNNKIVERVVDLENYNIQFSYENRKIRIIDPLELSVKNFMESVENNREPLIGYRHITSNMSLVKKIYDSYAKM